MHQSQMPAACTRQRFDNCRCLPISPDRQNDSFIRPFHRLNRSLRLLPSFGDDGRSNGYRSDLKQQCSDSQNYPDAMRVKGTWQLRYSADYTPQKNTHYKTLQNAFGRLANPYAISSHQIWNTAKIAMLPATDHDH